jgi:hypothetical protein
LEQLIDFHAPEVQAVLDTLLKDRSTGKNIIWATDPPEELQTVMYEPVTDRSQITTQQLGLTHYEVVLPRMMKQTDTQQQRTRKKGEVFSPAWVCNKMNNALDADWFRGLGAEETAGQFTVELPQGWQTVEMPVQFPACKGKTPAWVQYVQSRRLEVTCGEAPFLVSRYDAATGEMISVARRIGILDRKLRVVSENAATEDEWRKYATHAVQSTYGYEYQGDNLLLARVNLLLTYAEHLQARWQRKPTKEELQPIATIISWNLWQMDGLRLSVPGGKPQPEAEQLDLFSMFGTVEEQTPAVSCKVKNWRSNKTQNFETIQEGSTSMKFDYVIGNPPYQISDGGAGVSATPIYNRFIEAIKTTHPGAICLIIPAKWYSGGKGLDKFREEMLGDRHISTLVDYSNSLDVFPNVDVAGGVCYFVWKEAYNGKCKYTNYRNGKATTAYRDLNEFQTFIRYPVASEIVKKVKEDGELTLDKVVSSRKPFGLATTAKPMKTGDITLRYNGGRGPYKSTEIRVGTEMIDQWKIIISRLTAEHAGQPAKDGKYRVLSTMELLKPGEICSETYLVAGAFDSKEEATNYMDYLKTQFVRFLILQIAMTQQLSKASFAFVPCQDFTRKWTDKQLFEKYGLSSEEVNYIQGMIKEMA